MGTRLAKRVIAENAIRDLNPQRKHSSSSSVSTISSHKQQVSGAAGYFDVEAVLGLADFERFIFVLWVLEHYRDRECALLLNCSAREVGEARARAIAELASTTVRSLASSLLRSDRRNSY
jgi:hypothetical protein